MTDADRILDEREVERVRTRDAARMTGLPLRTVQMMAERRLIPGAAKLGSRWTFDRVTLRRWIAEREDAPCPKISIDAARRGTRASGSTERKSAEAYERLLGLRP